ncbi:MAG: S9 family peptidase, partial [Flavobacteriaceae bacterium]|nr:S9 family peptidase [Flavobacteriaceae bacterium]
KKNISVEEVWNGTFRQERLQALQSLKDGKTYIVQRYDRANETMLVEAFDYVSGNKNAVLIDASKINGLKMFQSFTLSADETKAILTAEATPVYRHSERGIYYVYDLATQKAEIIDEAPIQEPMFSPDNSKVAFVKENNLYVKDLSTNTVTPITKDGVMNEIINGITDWVYEEEFAFVRAFDWSADGNFLAFLRFDEREVPEFSMDIYGRYKRDLYPEQQVFKYPKAGEKNAQVELYIYNLKSGKKQQVNLGEYEYIPRLQWTKDPKTLSVQTTNRHQNRLSLSMVNAEDGTAKTVLTDTDAAYVDVTDDLTFLEDNSFIWTSEKDGWKHIYHYDKSGKLKQQITSGKWEVTRYYGYEPSSKRIFYQSTEPGSTNRGVYSIQLNGKNKRVLADSEGVNNASFSADFSYFINSHSSTQKPSSYILHDAKTGKVVREIINNNQLLEQLKSYHISPKELGEININGNTLNYWMIKPTNFDPNQKYPLFMYQYSGPGSQQVSNSFFGTNDYWFQHLASQGYIVVCVDGRGTGYKGRDFKKVTQLSLGKYELEDQVAAAIELGKRSYVDEARIGIWGWSYGGFMAANALFQANDVFKLAIAVAPVTSWRFYDTIYTERYMTTPQENPNGYDDNSPISHVDDFNKGHFLLVHGSADDNVHVQNTMLLIDELVRKNKPFDWRIYPDKNHGIYGGYTRLHLYNLMTEFISENL